MVRNDYIPFPSKILEVIKHTEIEYTFRMAFRGDVKPGQFFEVSIPKYGEAPISVSGIGDGFVDLTIRRVGKVTNEVFEHYAGDILLLRGPYGNGFNVKEYHGKHLWVITGGTGVAPVRALIDYFTRNIGACNSLTILSSFKKEEDILFRADYNRWALTAQVLVTLTRETNEHGFLSGRVTEHLSALPLVNAKQTAVVITGPHTLMHTTAELLCARGIPEKNIWISEERKMCCGLGKCGHCKVNDTYICLDGPVFNYTRGKTLID